MKNFLWYILVLLSFLNSSAQQANLNDSFALKLSETRNVDEHFVMSEDKFGVFHLDSIKNSLFSLIATISMYVLLDLLP